MFARIFCLVLLLAAALLPSGCASTDEAAQDQLDTYHSTPAPENSGDDHGWGTGISAMGH